MKTLIQTRAEGWRCIAGWHFQAFGPAMQTQLFTKICSSGQMPAERWCSNTGPRLHSFADGIQNKVELIAEFVTRLVNKGIYFWMCFYFSNISRKHINRAFTEKTYSQSVQCHITLVVTHNIITVQVKGRKPPLFSHCALHKGKDLIPWMFSESQLL